MPKSDGYKNLKPVKSKEEARIRGSKGGIASGKKRREIKTAKEIMIAALNEEIKSQDGRKATIKEIMMQKLLKKAAQEGDLNSIKYIVELIGESASQKIEVTGKDGAEIKLMNTNLSKRDAKKLVKEMGKEFGWDVNENE